MTLTDEDRRIPLSDELIGEPEEDTSEDYEELDFNDLEDDREFEDEFYEDDDSVEDEYIEDEAL